MADGTPNLRARPGRDWRWRDAPLMSEESAAGRRLIASHIVWPRAIPLADRGNQFRTGVIPHDLPIVPARAIPSEDRATLCAAVSGHEIPWSAERRTAELTGAAPGDGGHSEASETASRGRGTCGEAVLVACDAPAPAMVPYGEPPAVGGCPATLSPERADAVCQDRCGCSKGVGARPDCTLVCSVDGQTMEAVECVTQRSGLRQVCGK